MLTKKDNQTPIYFNAEIVEDERTQHIGDIDGEQYDSEQVQQAIAETDGGITLLRGIAQGSFLAGFQVVSSQYLYLAGCVGMFPAVVAGLPVGASFAATLCYLRFNGGIIPQVSDRQKLGIGITRTVMLAGSSWKLSADARQMDSIARDSFYTVTQQIKAYEGIEEPKQGNYGLFLAVVIAVSVLLFFYLRKK